METIKSIEEKAKAYDEAYKVAENIHRFSSDPAEIKRMEQIFPELKESEDEKIQKDVIKAFKVFKEKQAWVGHCLDFIDWDKCYAWLEKQSEKESDLRYKYLKELLRADDIYQMAMNDAMVQEAKTKAIDALSKLKIGNLLEIEKQGEQKPIGEHDFLKLASNSYSLSFINYLDAHLYEGKMCVSNGECEDIENAFRNADWGKIGRYYNKFTQKLAWSEEDKQYLEDTLTLLEGNRSVHTYGEVKNWLKSLRPQNK